MNNLKTYIFFTLILIDFNYCLITLQVGGNKNALEFFKSQPDWSDSMSIEQKYNTKAAALYRDKVNLIRNCLNERTFIIN